MQLPLIIISVGTVAKDRVRIFAAANAEGQIMLPLFTDLPLAERYKRHCVEVARRTTLDISITGNGTGGVTPLDLQLYVVTGAQNLADIVQSAVTIQRIDYIAIDPDPAVGKVLCLELDEFMAELDPDCNSDSEPSSGT